MSDRFVEEREVNPDGSTACGVFIPLPYDLARQFDGKRGTDDSYPHFTILYAGDMSPCDYKDFVNCVRSIAKHIRPFYLDLADYSEVKSADGARVAHMKPTPCASALLAQLHGLLRRHVEASGLNVSHSYGKKPKRGKVPYEVQFTPHSTLAYLKKDAVYNGPKPMGSWKVTELECWGHERYSVQLGHTYPDQPSKFLCRQKLSAPYPRAVKEHEDVLPGGLADRSKPSDFNAKQLALGIKVEREHTKDRSVAREIAMDHLKEDPRYYTKLATIHREADDDEEDEHEARQRERHARHRQAYDDKQSQWTDIRQALDLMRDDVEDVEESQASMVKDARHPQPAGAGPSTGGIGPSGSLRLLDGLRDEDRKRLLKKLGL